MNQQNKTDLIKHQIKQKEAKTNQKNSNKKKSHDVNFNYKKTRPNQKLVKNYINGQTPSVKILFDC